jgi:hypothetical protein
VLLMAGSKNASRNSEIFHEAHKAYDVLLGEQETTVQFGESGHCEQVPSTAALGKTFYGRLEEASLYKHR